jgi:DNA-binding transcriptional regulator YhcF (GntR family)
MIDIQLKPRTEAPIYLQIRTQLEAAIRDRQLPPGEALPAAAALARRLSVDSGEVTRAYFELEHAGLVTKTSGKDFLGKEKVTYTVK